MKTESGTVSTANFEHMLKLLIRV